MPFFQPYFEHCLFSVLSKSLIKMTTVDINWSVFNKEHKDVRDGKSGVLRFIRPGKHLSLLHGLELTLMCQL